MKLKPYPKYKDARITWLEKIPSHWQEQRAKFLFREIDERSSSGEEELLSVSHITGVTPRSQKNVTMFKAESYVGHKVCQPGDVVINTMWAWMAALGVAKHTGIVSPSYGVYRSRDQQNFLPEYIDQLLRTWGFVAEYNTRSTGIRSSRLRLYPDNFLDISMPVLPIEEQQKMIDYLKFENQKINRFIRNKRSLIKLLNEKKQVIINQAVTRGLNPSVSLKFSEISHLGEVPEHWEVTRLGKMITLQRGFDITKEQQMQGNIPVVSSGGIFSYHKEFTNEGPGVVIGRKGTLGTVHYIEGRYWAHDTTLWVRKFNDNNPRFIFYLLKNMSLERFDTGSANPTLNRNIIHPEFVASPSKQEQFQIANYLDRKIEDIERMSKCLKQEIELMQEYRARLISDVVTGKIDVRGLEIPVVPDEDVVEDLEDEELLEEAEAELEEDGNTDE